MKYKLIAIDLDGTLIKRLNKITNKNFQALKNFTNAGGQIVISTGRAITSARKIADRIEKYTGKKVPYIVTLCGSAIYDHENKIIYKNLIDPITTKQIVDLVKKLKLNIWIYQEGFETNGVYSNSLFLSLIAKVIKNIKLKKIDFSKVDIPSWKINVFGFRPKARKKFEKYIQTKLTNKIFIQKTNGFMYELSPINCSKGEAIKIIANKMEISLNNVAAIGDSGNDLSAAETVKCFGGIGKNKIIKSCSSENYSKFNSPVSKFINDRLLAKNHNVKLIASDLDGTALNNERLIDKEFSEDIKEFVHNDTPCLTLASGRCANDIYRIICKSDLKNIKIRYVIGNNGAIVYDLYKQKPHYFWPIHHWIANSVLKIVEELIDSKKYGKISCYFHVFNNKEYKKSFETGFEYLPKVYVYTKKENINTPIEEYLDSYEISKAFRIIPIFNLPSNDPIIKIIIFFTKTEYRDEILSLIKKSNLKINISSSSAINIEVNALYVSKGYALKKLAKFLKIKNTELLTLGDQRNDISMLKLTEWSFTFDNSPEDVKNAAKYVISYGGQNSIIKALKIYKRDINND